MSRKEKFSRRSARKMQSKLEKSTPEANNNELIKLPPRSKKFPSSKHKLTKWYYNFLFFLFVCLVAFLFWYGNRFSQ